MSVKERIFTSSLWSIAGTGAAILSNFIVFALLARLLQPIDFGLVAFAAIFIDLARNLMSGGIAEILIRNKEWDETLASTAFWFNLGSTLLFTIATAAIAVPLAYAYGSPTLAEVFLVLSLSLVIEGVRCVHEAKLRREFGYKVLALRTVVASIVGGAVGIALAVLGFGVWALVANRVLVAVLQTMVVVRAAPWTPRAVFSKAECTRLLSFGADMMGVRLLTQVGSKAAELVIGLILGPAALGLYSVASRALNLLFQVAISPIQTTALSAFSRLKDERAIGGAYLRLTRATALVSFPVYFGVAATAPDIVAVCFGRHWEQSGAIMTALALAAVPTTLVTFVQPALVTVGRTRLALLSSFGTLVLSSIAALATVAFGVIVVAIGQAFRAYAAAPFVLSLLKRGIGLSVLHSLRSIWEPCVAAVLMGGLVAVVRIYALADLSPGLRLSLCVALGISGYAAILMTVVRRYTAETLLELMPHLPSGARDIAQRIVPKV